MMPYMLVRSVWLTDEAAFVSYKHDSPRLPDQHRRRTQSRTSGDDMPNPPPEVTYQRQISAQETEEGLFRDTSAWGLISRMRAWRQDAIVQHLYQTAVFWGDKVFAWTSEYHQLNIRIPKSLTMHRPDEANDAFWLAQAHFLMADYRRAEAILTSPLPSAQLPRPLSASQVDSMLDEDSNLDPDPDTRFEKVRVSCKVPGLRREIQTGACDVVGGLVAGLDHQHPQTRLEDALGGIFPRDHSASGTENDVPIRPAGFASGPIVESSMACRYLATLCMVCP